jgi:hypothetical protein
MGADGKLPPERAIGIVFRIPQALNYMYAHGAASI